MDRRSKLSEVRESEVPKLIERSPLIDPRRLRSCRSTPASKTLLRPTNTDTRNAQRRSYTLKPISEVGGHQPIPGTLNRSRSTPLRFPSSHHLTQCPSHARSPQYRVNPIVRFSERPFPERMNYGIAGYNTAWSRSRSITESTPARPRSFSGFSSAPETKTRPRSVTSVSIPESATNRASRSMLWRSWTRRFRDKMGRVRVRDTCSKLLSRFRGGHL